MSQDNINININETNPIINIVSSEIVETIDINVGETIEEVVLNITEEVIQVNVNKVQGGGAVDSVNGQDGDVVLDADDISDVGTINKFVTSSEKSAITHTNRSVLDQITEAFTTALKTAYDSAVSWISTNGTNLLNHLSNTSNPHSTTATQVDALQRNGSNANSNINIGEYSFKAGQFELDQTPTGTAGVAITRWNDTIGSTETTLKGGNVVLKNGVDLVARVVNKVTPNTTLTKAAYQAVRVSSAQGQRLAVSLAQANNDNNSADTIGLVCETIATNQEGFIITVGQLDGINTTGSLQGETWSDGDVLYLSPTTAGRLTNIKPTGASGHIVVIGYVEYAHQNNGKIYVKVMNGWELDELHNVSISTPLNNQALTYNSSTQLWENETIDKSFVGLGNVDNTSDANKPISTSTQTALNAKQNTLVSGTNIETIEGISILGSGDYAYFNNLFFEQNLGYMIANVGATTYTTLRSTNSIIQTGQTADFNVPSRMLYASSTTIGSFATQRGTQGGTYSLVSASKFYFKRRFQIDSNISGSRFVCGLSNQFTVASPTNVEPDTLINTIGVCKLSTSNNLHIFYNDATGLATTVDLGVNYPANNVTAYSYDLEIFKDNGSSNITLKLTRIDSSGNRISTTQVINTNYNTLVNYNPVIYGTNNATASAFRFFDFGIIFKNYNLQWDTI